MTQEPKNIFDAYYYKTSCGIAYERNEHWLHFFDAIAERIVQDLQPQAVLDAGCAMGFLVEMLRKRGVQAYGVDISEYAIHNVHPDIQTYCWVGPITDPLPQEYDLIVTIEVLEHLPKEDAEKAIENLCRQTDQVLFSSGIDDLGEITHINLQPPEYWASVFARYGFYRDIDFDATFITPWAVLFRRVNKPTHRIIMDYERQINRLIQENSAIRQVNLQQKAMIAQQENELIAFHRQQRNFYASRVYQAARRIQFVSPSGSRREKILLSIWNTLAGIKHWMAGDRKKQA